MELAIIGLGKMGLNMVERLTRDGHTVYGYSRSKKHKAAVAERGGIHPDSYEELVTSQKQTPKVVWLMVPEGDPVDENIEAVLPYMSKGDVIIDGGNTMYKDTKRRFEYVTGKGLHYMDAGTSGGVWGLEVGYCLMVGGTKEAFEIMEPIYKSLAPPDGYLHCGPAGAGHYVKMVHNGIEYGMMQAYAEGFQILEHSEYDLNLEKVSHLWNQGSVIRSWLCELAELMFAEDTHLENITGFTQDSGEGRWTVQEAIDLSVPAPVITLSLLTRFRSRQNESFSDKCVAALRRQFGGHSVQKKQQVESK
ncbi:MAG TPA: decarboxylating 6-phosphogluconate dehydrogenase [bacterium]|jgi:6-phosphogluconate dehydrogenase